MKTLKRPHSGKLSFTLICCLSLLWATTTSAFAEIVKDAKILSATPTPIVTPTPAVAKLAVPEDATVKQIRENIEKHIMMASQHAKDLGLSGDSLTGVVDRINSNPVIKTQYEYALKKMAELYKKNTGSDEFKRLEAKENAGETLTVAEQKRLRAIRTNMFPPGFIAKGNIGPTGKIVSDNSYGPMKALNDRAKKTASNLKKIGEGIEKNKNEGYFVQNQTVSFNPDYQENDDKFSQTYRKDFLNTTATASALSENESICTPNGAGTESYYELITAAKKYEAQQTEINRNYESNIETIKADYAAKRAASIDKTVHDSNVTLLNEQEQRDYIAQKADLAAKSADAQQDFSQEAAGAGNSAGGEGASNMGLLIAAMAIIVVAIILIALGFWCFPCLIAGIALLIIGLVLMIVAMTMQNKMGTKSGGGPQPAQGSSLPSAAANAINVPTPTPVVPIRATPSPMLTPSPKLTPSSAQDSYTPMIKQEEQLRAKYTSAQKRTSSVANLDVIPYEGKTLVGKKAEDGSKEGDSKIYKGTVRSLDAVNYHKAAYNNAVAQLESCCPEPETRKQYAMEVSALAGRTAKESSQAAAMLNQQAQDVGSIANTVEENKVAGADGMDIKDGKKKMKASVESATRVHLPNIPGVSDITSTLSVLGNASSEREVFNSEKTEKSEKSQAGAINRFSNVSIPGAKQAAARIKDKPEKISLATKSANLKDLAQKSATSGHAGSGDVNIVAVEAQLDSMKKNMGKLQGTGSTVTLTTTETSVSETDVTGANAPSPTDTVSSTQNAEGEGIEQTNQNSLENNNGAGKAVIRTPESQLLDSSLDIFNIISNRYRSTAFPLLIEPAASSM